MIKENFRTFFFEKEINKLSRLLIYLIWEILEQPECLGQSECQGQAEILIKGTSVFELIMWAEDRELEN